MLLLLQAGASANSRSRCYTLSSAESGTNEQERQEEGESRQAAPKTAATTDKSGNNKLPSSPICGHILAKQHESAGA
jgi:Tfp pilus assembly protein PilX